MRTQLQKSAIALAIIMLLASAAFAQTWLWPMAGHKAGENIISQPDSHVGKEFNCCDLYIGGDEGNIVICPADGTIINADITYYHSQDASEGFFTDPEKTWDENLCEIKVKDNINRQYLSGHISTMFFRICNPKELNIRILNPQTNTPISFQIHRPLNPKFLSKKIPTYDFAFCYLCKMCKK